jgi:hypothetical protein
MNRGPAKRTGTWNEFRGSRMAALKKARDVRAFLPVDARPPHAFRCRGTARDGNPHA